MCADQTWKEMTLGVVIYSNKCHRMENMEIFFDILVEITKKWFCFAMSIIQFRNRPHGCPLHTVRD